MVRQQVLILRTEGSNPSSPTNRATAGWPYWLGRKDSKSLNPWPSDEERCSSALRARPHPWRGGPILQISHAMRAPARKLADLEPPLRPASVGWWRPQRQSGGLPERISAGPGIRAAGTSPRAADERVMRRESFLPNRLSGPARGRSHSARVAWHSNLLQRQVRHLYAYFK